MMIERSLRCWKTEKRNKTFICSLLALCLSLPFFAVNGATAKAEFGGSATGVLPHIFADYNVLGGYTLDVVADDNDSNYFQYMQYTLPTIYEYNEDTVNAYTVTDYGTQFFNFYYTGFTVDYIMNSDIHTVNLYYSVPTIYNAETFFNGLRYCHLTTGVDTTFSYGLTAWSWTEEEYVPIFVSTYQGSSMPLEISPTRTDIYRTVDGTDYIMLGVFTLTATINEPINLCRLSITTNNNPTYAENYNSVRLFEPLPVYTGDVGLFGFVDDFFNMEIFPNFRLYTLLILGLGATLIGLFMKLFLGG